MLLRLYRLARSGQRFGFHLQPHVNFSELLAEPIRTLARSQMVLGLLEGLEQDLQVPFVRLLGGGESGLVDTVVDLVVVPVVRLLDLLLEGLGIQDYAAVFLVDDVVKLRTRA